MTKMGRTNAKFLAYARRKLNAWARRTTDDLDREWTYVLDGGRRVVRLTLFRRSWTHGRTITRGRTIFDVSEVSEEADPETLYRWALDVVREDELEARRLAGYDPRRCSDGARDAWFDLANDLRELRNLVDGWVVEAGERGEVVDRELAAEMSEELARLCARAEEVLDG